MKPFYAEGLQFSCTQCGHCCADEPGYVFLTEQEIQQISTHLACTRSHFLDTYCRTIPMGQFSLISLLEKKNNDCIFFNERKQCEIYEVRPVQCRSYPFWEQLVQDEASWKAESLQCPGIGKGRIHSRQEIEHWLHLRRKNPPKMVM